MPLYAVVTREYFGERAMGTAYGGVFFISCIGMGLGSYAGGVIHDLLGYLLVALPGLGRHRDHGDRAGLTLGLRAVPVPRPSPALGGERPFPVDTRGGSLLRMRHDFA